MWIHRGWAISRGIRATLPSFRVDSWQHAVRSGDFVSKFQDWAAFALGCAFRRWSPRCCCSSAGIPTAAGQLADDIKARRGVHAMRPYVRYVDSSRYIDKLANGDICLAMGWSATSSRRTIVAKKQARASSCVSHPKRARSATTTCSPSLQMHARADKRTPVHQNTCYALRDRGEKLHLIKSRKTPSRPTSSRSIQACAEIRVCIRRPRCARG